MPIKKSELYSSLWKSCDELRGGMDASQYKDYVLVLLFVKYVSDKYAAQKNALLNVPKGGGFADMVALKGDKEIGDKMNKIIARLAEANELKGVIDVADFNDADKLGKGKEMVDRLSNLVSIFDTPALNFRSNGTDGDDLLGDAYEYLMRNFATQSGKSKGQFYTPAEVSRVMAQVIGLGSAKSADQTIHDPTCGSGSLLLKAHDEAKSRTGYDLALYGQEMDNATAALARMNVILHDCPSAEIWKDNTLSTPHFKTHDGRLKTFDFVVANFPFSNKAWSNGFDPANDLYGRFAFGIPPKKNGDYAFLLHILTCLKSTGKGAVIHPHGVLFRGNAEAVIRREIIKRGYIKGIIGLPANLFFGTNIAACILVLDKENAGTRTDIFMVDASKGFIKDGNKNRLRAQDIHCIVDTFTRQIEVPRYSRMVPLTEISDPKNDYNLNIPRYIDSTEPEDLQDIDGHLRGGIPARDIDALDRYWQVFPAVRQILFESVGRPGYSRLKIPAHDIKAAIFGHTEFTAFNASVTTLFEQWKITHAPHLHAITIGDHPKALIEILSEDLLATFGNARLIDAYDMYQHLMDYWAATMQDDVYLITHAGWVEAAKPRLIVETKEQKSKEQPDFIMGKQKFKSDLIPAALLVARYFKADQVDIEAREAELGSLEQQLEELKEEHGSEGGLLEEVVDDKGKISKKTVITRLKEIASDEYNVEERKVLEDYVAMLNQIAETKGRLKTAQEELEAKAAGKYGKLTEDEIKSLVVDNKWLAQLTNDVQNELDRVSQTLTGRIRQLADRYATPLPQITEDVKTLTARVDEHLRKMGGGMALKPSYKQTEVGVIPEEWDVHQICDIANVKRPFGSTLHERDYVQDGTPIITVEHLNEFGVLHSNLPMVSESDEQRLKAYALDENDIVFSRVGSIDRTLIRSTEAGWLFSGRLLRIRLNTKKVFAPYLSYHLHTEPFKQRVKSVAVGQTMPSLNTQILNGINVVIPPLPEQHTIASALGDVDSLIRLLENLIAKKRNLKQAAMQLLLTGQKRLPGFHGEWEVKRLGDVIEKLVGGGTPSRADPAFWGEGIPWVTVKDFATFHPCQTQESITKEGLNQSASNLIPAGTLILSTRMALGKAVIYAVDVAINQDLKALFIRPNTTSHFLYYWFEHHARMIDELGSGSTVKGLSIRDLKGIPFLLTSVAEQTAITTVLSDMDSEIAALEVRLAKTRDLKQGMMQELLTGRIRLL